jgi:hypothetical protein
MVEEIFEDQRKKGVPISGLVIEPIQAEGGDNHASKEFFHVSINPNGTPHIRHQCRKTVVLSCHRCLLNSGVEKMNNI